MSNDIGPMVLPQCEVELHPDTVMQGHTRVRCFQSPATDILPNQNADAVFWLCDQHLESWNAGMPLIRYTDGRIFRRVPDA